jgi:peptidylprolyl isomerase
MHFRSLATVLALLAAVPAQANDKLPPGVIARMGDVELKAEELRPLVEALPPEARAQLAQNPAELQRIVRTEVLRKALAAEARGKGWDRRPEVVIQMERAREQALVATYMNNIARPPEGFPSDAEIKAAYDASQQALATPRQFKLAQIFVLAPPESDKAGFEKARAKAADLATRAKAKGADFAALAKSGSEHAESAARGGDMGWVADANLLPELREPVAAMKKGEVVGPVKASQGWHVVRLEDVREKGVRPLAEVRDQIVASLRLRKAQETEQAYLTFMTNKNPVNLNDAELSRIVGGAK